MLKPVFPEAHNNMANLHRSNCSVNTTQNPYLIYLFYRDRGDLFEAITSYAKHPSDNEKL